MRSRFPRIVLIVALVLVFWQLASAAPTGQAGVATSAPLETSTPDPKASATPDPKASATPDASATKAAPQVKFEIDSAAVAHLSKLSDFETAYKAGHRNFYQQLWSNSVTPADGAALAPDLLNAGPTDQAEKLADFLAAAQLPATMEYASKVDVYDGPDGPGYVLSLRVILAGQLWQRSINTGPEAWRDQAWAPMAVPGQ